MKNKLAKILLYIFIFLILLIAIAAIAIRMYFRLPASDYYKNATKEFVIPGISENFIPQGISYDERTNYFFVTGYMTNKKPSPIYIVDKESNLLVKKINLSNQDGTAFTGHSGGLTVYGDYIYVANGSGLRVFSYTDILNAKNNESVNSIGYFSTKVGDDSIRVSFTAIYDNQLFVAEYYDTPGYETTEKHVMTTKAGDFHQSLGVAYNFSSDEGSEFGLSTTPNRLYSLPNQVQGACFNDGIAYLSTSRGFGKSHIKTYELSKLENQGTIDFFGQELEVYAFDSSSLIKDTKTPPMSEEIIILDNRLYTMSEFASNKYILGKFTSAKFCYSVDTAFFK